MVKRTSRDNIELNLAYETPKLLYEREILENTSLKFEQHKNLKSYLKG
jgi:hypothetical protein